MLLILLLVVSLVFGVLKMSSHGCERDDCVPRWFYDEMERGLKNVYSGLERELDYYRGRVFFWRTLALSLFLVFVLLIIALFDAGVFF